MLGPCYQRKKIINQRASGQVELTSCSTSNGPDRSSMKLGGRPELSDSWRGLNRQSLQPGPIANHERRCFQPDPPLFLQMT